MTRIWATANYLFEKYEQNGLTVVNNLTLNCVKKVRVFAQRIDIIIYSSTKI